MGYFNIKRAFFIVPSEKCYVEFEKIDKFILLLENSGVGKIIESVNKKREKCKGKYGYNTFNLFATIIFCFSKFKATIRNIEEKFIFDLRVIYIMEGKLPKHTVIGEFINEYIVPYQYEIFTCITNQIIKEFNLNVSDTYLDGTKIEANANKYKFVWKPTTFHKKLDVKIKEMLKKMNLEFKENKLIKSYELNDLIKKYLLRENIDINSIPIGKGKRLSKEQRNYKEIRYVVEFRG